MHAAGWQVGSRAACGLAIVASLLFWLCLAANSAHAGSLQHCTQPPALSAAQHDRLLRVSAVIREELERSGTRTALMARSGLNLRWFDMRYSHAGLSLRGSGESRWAVRQLYFSCDEQQPRLFDQGLSAFVLGTEDPSLGYVSVIMLPDAAAATLEPVALDNRRALSLLSPNYSANAHTWSLRLQNCNQWLAELLALAWGPPALAQAGPDARAAAQGWLKAQGYQGAQFHVGWRPLLWLTAFSPWLHLQDHPEADLAQARLVVSMPESIESFVRSQVADAERVEFCHTDRHVVVRRGWEPLAPGCVPGEQDRVVSLN
jgi:hypothetical protein